MQAEEEERTDPPSAAAGARRPPRLVLHFDLNETIMVTDAAGGDDFNACLNKMVAKSVFLKGDFEKHKHGDGATQPLTSSSITLRSPALDVRALFRRQFRLCVCATRTLSRRPLHFSASSPRSTVTRSVIELKVG